MTKEQAFSSRHQMRLLAGLVVQPVLAAALTFLAFPVIDATGRPLYGGHASDSGQAALSVALAVGFAATAITVALVLPTVLWLVQRREVTFRQSLLYGVLFGNVPVLIGTLLAGNYGLAGFVRASVIGTVLGVSGAAVFWLISLRGWGFTQNETAG